MSAALTNPYVNCPYEKAHAVPKLRLQRHLIKCRANNPELAAILKTCPFNATHIMPERELPIHFPFCPDRNLTVDGRKYTPVHGDLGNPEFHLDVPVGDWDESDDEDPIDRIYGPRNGNDLVAPVQRDETLPGGALGARIHTECIEDDQPIMSKFMGMGRGRLHTRLASLDSSFE